MNCLNDYIGIYGCGAATPESGLFINELPGISLQSIDRIADSDQQTYVNVWNDVQKRAYRRLSADVAAMFAKRYRIKTITDSVQLPRNVEVTTLTTAAAEQRGITIELNPASAESLVSGLQVIHVQKLEGYFLADVDGLVFNVLDLDTGLTLETFTKDVVEGWNTIALNKDYFASRIFISYDATAVESVTLELPQAYDCGCHILSSWGFDHCQGNIKGAIYADGEIQLGTNSFGVSAILGVQCRYDALVCNNKNVFANALWYLLGAELMTERIYSDRLNRYTTIDRTRALELRNEFRTQYGTELDSAISGINLNHYDCCLECAAQLQYQEATL